MLPALGAASSLLDALLSPTSSKSPSQPTGFSQASSNPFDLTGNAATSGSSTAAPCSGGCSQISPATMSALLAAQSQSTTASAAPPSRADALKDLFSQLDANGDGQVSKSEFESALGAGGTNLARADDVFSKLDKNGDGSVSLDELSSALKGAGGKGHRHHHHLADTQALSGASSTQVTNSDGTTTTSVTYADGSKVTLTSAPATKSSSTATSSYNFVEQLIAREAKAIPSGASAALSLNV